MKSSPMTLSALPCLLWLGPPFQVERAAFDVDELPALAAQLIQKPNQTVGIDDAHRMLAWQGNGEQFPDFQGRSFPIRHHADSAVLPLVHRPTIIQELAIVRGRQSSSSTRFSPTAHDNDGAASGRGPDRTPNRKPRSSRLRRRGPGSGFAGRGTTLQRVCDFRVGTTRPIAASCETSGRRRGTRRTRRSAGADAGDQVAAPVSLPNQPDANTCDQRKTVHGLDSMNARRPRGKGCRDADGSRQPGQTSAFIVGIEAESASDREAGETTAEDPREALGVKNHRFT